MEEIKMKKNNHRILLIILAALFCTVCNIWPMEQKENQSKNPQGYAQWGKCYRHSDGRWLPWPQGATQHEINMTLGIKKEDDQDNKESIPSPFSPFVQEKKVKPAPTVKPAGSDTDADTGNEELIFLFEEEELNPGFDNPEEKETAQNGQSQEGLEEPRTCSPPIPIPPKRIKSPFSD